MSRWLQIDVGERGGNLWQIYRGGRVGHRIVDAIVDVAGLGVYVKIEPPPSPF